MFILTPEERQAATVLFRSLSAAKSAYDSGERQAESLRALVRATVASEPLARLQYVSCADYDTLEELETVSRKGAAFDGGVFWENPADRQFLL